MIDTHAHIDTEIYDDDRFELIEEAFKSGIKAIIIPAIEPKDFKRVLHATSLSDKIFCAMGIHPHNANETTRPNLQLIEQLSAEEPDVVAIGETGLDYYYDFNPADIQARSFINQINIAKNLDLPLIIHNRNSDEDMMAILKKEQDGKLKAVLHCFSGDERMLEEALDLGFDVSFTGNITFKKSKMDNIIKQAPLSHIMLETDSPYMTPEPNRGKRNDPTQIRYIAQKIADIKSISINEVIEMTTKNAKNFFKLSLMILLLCFVPLVSMAQYNEEYDNNYIADDDTETAQDYYNPYRKHLGGGFILGTNTIVQTYQPGDDERSQEGILAYGGGLSYFLNDYLGIQGSYFYSKNDKISKKNPEFGLSPNYHQMMQLSLYAYTTPWKIINLFGMIGVSYSYNDISIGQDQITNKPISEIDSDMGINTGVGFQVNIDANKAGIFVVSAEWKVDFIFGKTQLEKDYRVSPTDPNYNNPIEISNFYSVPQFKLYWYPKFNK